MNVRYGTRKQRYYSEHWRKTAISVGRSGRAYISIPFSWLLPKVRQFCEMQEDLNNVWVGGPAVEANPEYLRDVALVSNGRKSPVEDMLSLFNPFATRTSKGCPRACPFCINARRGLEELPDFTPRQLVCDDNFLATSRKHQEIAVAKLRQLDVVDFNQGLDAQLLAEQPWSRRLLQGLPLEPFRVSFDHEYQRADVIDMIRWAKKTGIEHVHCYLLVGWRETFEEAMERALLVEMEGAVPNVMRYQPLDVLEKNSYVPPQWSERELQKFTRYWNRRIWTSRIPYEEFDMSLHHRRGRRQAQVQ